MMASFVEKTQKLRVSAIITGAVQGGSPEIHGGLLPHRAPVVTVDNLEILLSTGHRAVEASGVDPFQSPVLVQAAVQLEQVCS